MRIQEISESFQRVDNEYFNGLVEVLTNPSRTVLMKRMRESGGARGFLDFATQSVHVWFEAALHGDIEAAGNVFLTWNEPAQGRLKAEYDETIWDFIDEDDDVDEAMLAIRPFARLAQGFRLQSGSR